MRVVMYNNSKILIPLVFMLLISAILTIHATNDSIIIHTESSETITIGRWELTWPLDDYRIDFYVIPSFKGDNKLSWSIDKNLISPGEELHITVNLEEGKHDYRMGFRAIIIKKSTSEIIFDKTVEIPVTISVPGRWSSPSVTIPVIPFEIAGFPVELSITYRFSFVTRYFIMFTTYGLDPSERNLEFAIATSTTIDFKKISGVGAEVQLTDAAVKIQGEVTISAGLSIAGIPTPFKKDFATVPITDWVVHSTQNISIALLKTPIRVDIQPSSILVNLGEPVTISGQVSPPVNDVQIQIIVENAIVGTAKTDEGGVFTFTWSPSYNGVFSIILKPLETKYIIPGEAATLKLIVNKPPEASFTFSPTNPVIGESIQFIDTSNDIDGQVIMWIWDFGDGTTSTEKNPTHIYHVEGTYTVSLTVTDNNNAKSAFVQTIKVAKVITVISSSSVTITPSQPTIELSFIVIIIVLVAIITVLLIIIVLLIKRLSKTEGK
jgi:hypothetical protein